MHAIIKTGGKQYRVKADDEIYVELLDYDVDAEVIFDQVLMLDNKIGKPLIKGASVKAKVIKHGKSKKVITYKYRAKKDSHTKKGHRQNYTLVKITEVA